MGTHHLQLVLPEFLLAGLVEKRKLADMVDKDIAQERKFRVDRRDLANIRLEGSAEAAEGRGRVELGDLPFGLLSDQLPFEV